MVVKLLFPVIHDGEPFQTGSILHCENESDALRLISLGVAIRLDDENAVVTKTETPTETQTETINPADLTVNQLKGLLSDMGIPYRTNDNKATLIAIYKDATS
jgi:hypothetical protein